MNAHWFSGPLRVATALALGSVIAPGVSEAASSNKLLGALTGSVRDNGGVPQMGAVVQLFNEYDRQIERALTNSSGEFGFQSLLPDVYSIRVTLSSFMPALKRNITIQAGATSVLAINLASVLSSVELVYSSPNSGALMSEDWKWVLRSSMSTRPVLRMIDLNGISSSSSSPSGSIFSDTRGVVRVSSSGEGIAVFFSPIQSDSRNDIRARQHPYSEAAICSLRKHRVRHAVRNFLPTGFRTTFTPGQVARSRCEN